MKKKNEVGILPPQCIDLEKNVLGAVLLEGEKAYTNVASIFENKFMFYRESHNIIWDSIISLINKKEAVDMSTVTNELNIKNKLKEIGGPLFIVNLTKTVGSAANIKTHARMIRQTFIARELIKISSGMTQKAFEGEDVFTIIKDFDYELSNIYSTDIGKSVNISDAIDNSLYDIKGRKDGTALSRIKTNSDFDEVFDISPNELIWIGALPKAGKTKTIINLVSMLLKEHDNVSFNWFSMEDDQTKLLANIASLETEIKTKLILGKEDDRLSEKEYDNVKLALDSYRNYDVKISYGTHSVDDVFLQSKNFVRKRKDKFNIVIIDNFNILRDAAKGNKDLEKENYVAGKIQQLKMETNSEGFNTCIIVLDHLNKEAAKDLARMAGRPTKSTLIGTSRKEQILTQLVSINKPSEFPELVDEEYAKKPLIINNTIIKRDRIFNKLIIYEVLVSRESSSVNKILRMLADFDNMQFESLNDFILKVTKGINPKNKDDKDKLFNNIQEDDINEKLEITKDDIDTTFLNPKEIDDVPF